MFIPDPGFPVPAETSGPGMTRWVGHCHSRANGNPVYPCHNHLKDWIPWLALAWPTLAQASRLKVKTGKIHRQKTITPVLKNGNP